MSAPSHRTIGNRYHLKGDPIGHGGMGVVYQAYDTVTQRDVALKTLKGVDRVALDLFRKEWTVLAQISHPNIVDVIDSGEFEEGGERKPYFVMPLLPGATLERLIRASSPRLTVARVIEIIAQTCKGLQAAHDRGLVHRDLKPSNIFVMDDDSVKIIDFGVVHLAEGQSMTGIKGTLPYMAPELLQLNPATASSDIFALGVVCYESLTGRNPFRRETDPDTAEAIRRYVPPPISEVNATATVLVSRVVHKAMAKQPGYRFSSAREFASTLQKALRNETIEGFDRVRLGPRIERVKKACAEGDYRFASEMIAEIESEGHIDPELTVLRGQVELALRQRSVRQHLDGARARIDEGEFGLALQKIQEALEIDPENSEAKLLRAETEQRRGATQIENWRRLVRQHIENRLYAQARQGLQEILKLDPGDVKAREMLGFVDRQEQQFLMGKKQKEELYQSAVRAFQGGEISSALDKLEQILQLTRGTSDSAPPERDAEYQRFYNQVRTERDEYRNAHAEGSRLLGERNFEAAHRVCAQMLNKYPGDALFQALKLGIDEQERQEQSAFVGEVNRRVDAEADLERKYAILTEAAERFPKEPHFQQSLRLLKERLDLVHAIVTKARLLEERGQYSDALSQWDILRNIYGQYPGLQFEVERLVRRREGQTREEAKGRWVREIDADLAAGEYARAAAAVARALEEFPDDRELAGLDRLVKQAIGRSGEARSLFDEGKKLCDVRRFDEGIGRLKAARALDERSQEIRSALVTALLEQARAALNEDWHAADGLVLQALELDPYHPVARSLRALVDDYQRQERVEELICQAREMQAAGDIEAALARVEQGLQTYPNDVRLSQLQTTLRNALPETRQRELRDQFLKQLKALVGRIDEAPPDRASELFEQSRVLAARYPNDVEFRAIATEIGRRSLATRTLSPIPVGVSDGGAKAQPAPVAPVPSAVVQEPRPGPAPAPAVRRDPLAPVRVAWGRTRPMLAPVERVLRKQPLLFGVGATAAVLLIAGYWVNRWNKPKPAPQVPVAEVEIQPQADIPGVRFTPPQGTRLKEGTHTITAIKDGYQPISRSITIEHSAGSPFPIPFHMEPEPVRLEVPEGLGEISIDGQPPAPMQEGAYSASLKPGQHELKLSDKGKELLTLKFDAPAAEAPKVTSLAVKEVEATVISSFTDNAILYASDGVEAAQRDQPVGKVPQDGIRLTGLNPGNAIAHFHSPKGDRPAIPIDAGNAPRLVLRVASDRNIGWIVVSAGIANAEVVIDDKPRKNRTKLPSSTYEAEPGTHRVLVRLDGYEAPQAQTVDVKKGQSAKPLTFQLSPVVTTGTLVIEGGTPGAEVYIDGKLSDTIAGDGSLRKPGVPAGSHDIVVRKSNFDDLPDKKAFQAKGETKVNGKLRQWGSLIFDVTPPDANVTYLRGGDITPRQGMARGTVALSSGKYEVQATAPNHLPDKVNVEVLPGQPAPARLILIEAEHRAPPPPPPPTRDLFDSSWAKKDGWRVHTGPAYGWLTQGSGRFAIELGKPKGGFAGVIKAHINWVADYADPKNGVFYSWNGKNLTRKTIVDGRTTDEKSPPMNANSDGGVVFEVDITDKLVVRQGGRIIDSAERPKGGPGKIGFKGDLSAKITHAP